jgi:hypothetical protein
MKDLNYRTTKRIQTNELAAKFIPNRMPPLVDGGYQLMYRIVIPLTSDSGPGFPLTSIQAMGESSIKTLVQHLKMKGLIDSTKIGTWMTEKGRKLFSEVLSLISTETSIAKCSIAPGKFNHAFW